MKAGSVSLAKTVIRQPFLLIAAQTIWRSVGSLQQVDV
jgi:hypothetical protein